MFAFCFLSFSQQWKRKCVRDHHCCCYCCVVVVAVSRIPNQAVIIRSRRKKCCCELHDDIDTMSDVNWRSIWLKKHPLHSRFRLQCSIINTIGRIEEKLRKKWHMFKKQSGIPKKHSQKYCKLVKVRTLCILCNNWSLFVPRELTPKFAWRTFKHSVGQVSSAR